MNKVELAYICGFIDADGCIALYKNKGGYRPSIEIAQVHLPILKWIKDKLGYGRIYTREGKGKNRTAYILSLFPSEVRSILPIILPYLKCKNVQAELLLKYFDVVDTSVHRDKTKLHKFKSIKNKFDKLNKRGK